MGFSIQSLWPFVLLAVVPLVWWIPARTLTSFRPRQLRLQACARAATLVLIALALAQPVWRRSSDRLSVAFAVDVSDSVSPGWIADAARWIDQARASGRGDVRLFAFGAEPVSIDAPAALRRADLRVGRDATNLAAAMSSALDVLEPNAVRRLVLLTDGRATAGDLTDALARALRDHVRIYTVPAAVQTVRDAWIESVDAPDEVRAGEPFAVDVTVGSQVEQSAVIEVREQGRGLARQAVRLGSGSTRVTLGPRVTEPGPRMLEVVLQADADTDRRNNERRLALVARPRPRVLYVESRAESARYLTRALEAGGFRVDAMAPDRLPATVEGLSSYAAVILSDIARRDMPDERMAALDRYVADLGGGLVMAGGEAMHGVEGYAKTLLERTLPITFQMNDRPDEFAMVIVLDKSWSMAGRKIELAKEAAVAAVEVLADRHRIGLIVFNDGMEWTVPLQLASNRERITTAIRAIVPSGHTNLFPAIQEASRALSSSKSDMKHVLVLSDGRTYPDAYEALLRKMVDAGITVSSVALGEDADRELLASLAAWGRGRHYTVENAVEVPQVFVKETERATRSTFAESPFRPIVKKPVELLAGLDLASAPPLLGYARAQAKETAEVVLAAGEDDDPILVRWQYGLGRAVAFTSDVKDRWARDWLAWRGYGKFWTQLVRETMRADETTGGDARPALRVTRTGDRARVELTMIDAGGAAQNLVALRAEVAGPDGPPALHDLRQTGPGVYATDVGLGAGDYTIKVLGADGRRVLAERRVLAGPALERRFMPADAALLRAIARDTGGAYDPGPADVFADLGDRAVVSAPLWPWLAGLAAVLWLVDLALRRVRLFERV